MAMTENDLIVPDALPMLESAAEAPLDLPPGAEWILSDAKDGKEYYLARLKGIEELVRVYKTGTVLGHEKQPSGRHNMYAGGKNTRIQTESVQSFAIARKNARMRAASKVIASKDPNKEQTFRGGYEALLQHVLDIAMPDTYGKLRGIKPRDSLAAVKFLQSELESGTKEGADNGLDGGSEVPVAVVSEFVKLLNKVIDRLD